MARFYKDGKEIARIPWPQKGTMSMDGTVVTAEPGSGTVDAATTGMLALVDRAPEIAGKAVDAFANHAEKQ